MSAPENIPNMENNAKNKQIVMGVDLGGTNVRAGKVLYGHSFLLKHQKSAISSGAPEEIVLNEIFSVIDQVMDDDISAIGVGVPSVVDVDRGIVFAVENIPAWKEVHLKWILEKRYDIPAFINNDANCFALGEAFFGKGRNFKNLVGLTVGTGIGAGIVINRRIYNGVNCGAGEIGMIPFNDKNIEYYASGQFFTREYGLSGSELSQRAQAGDNGAIEIFNRFGVYIGQAIMTVMYAYDPEIIILGGSVSKSLPFFEKSMRETLGAFAYQHALKRLVLDISEREEIPLLGAAALCFNDAD